MPDDGTAVNTRALWERGRARYPELDLKMPVFVEYLRARLPPEIGDLAKVPAEDLFLACACLQGVPGAGDRFADEHRTAMATFVAPVARAPHAIEELVSV